MTKREPKECFQRAVCGASGSRESDSYGFRAGWANAFAIGRHAGTALSVQGLIEPVRGTFVQCEWYRGLLFVSFFEAGIFSFSDRNF